MEVSVPCPGSSQCLLYSFVLTLGLLAPNKCSSTDGRLPDERQWFYFVYASLGTYFSALFFAVLNYAIKSECQPHQRQQSQELVSLLYAPQKLIFQLRSWVLLTFQLLLFNGGLLLCNLWNKIVETRLILWFIILEIWKNYFYEEKPQQTETQLLGSKFHPLCQRVWSASWTLINKPFN